MARDIPSVAERHLIPRIEPTADPPDADRVRATSMTDAACDDLYSTCDCLPYPWIYCRRSPCAPRRSIGCYRSIKRDSATTRRRLVMRVGACHPALQQTRGDTSRHSTTRALEPVRHTQTCRGCKRYQQRLQ
ncbi:hypothetical protein XHC_3101 [Xanthomonas hortorum pv. carotae str. M081]|nr:hypothetical protein XHC_3101 [Xanthomonas hortorum pv. carotae str. M081]